jgi:Ca2+-binding RTX toxin-like protein
MKGTNNRLGVGAIAMGLAALTVLLGVTMAVAKPIKGTNGDDTITGTVKRDRILALAGNDTVNALAGRDKIKAGPGNDTVDAGDGRDYVRAGDGDDTIRGGNGNDRIFAERGVDTEYGGAGHDDLWAMAHKDVTGVAGEPADTLFGEDGHDRFHVRDGEADHVDCGNGIDVVLADYKDIVTQDCEYVFRHAPRNLNKGKGHNNKPDKQNQED